MTNPAGTVWESDIVGRAQARGLVAARYPKMAQKDEPDLYIETERRAGPLRSIGVVAWKRLVGKKDGKPRQPDGERRVVVIEFDDFLELVSASMYEYHVEVQAKATKALNVTRVLGGLRTWMKGRPA